MLYGINNNGDNGISNSQLNQKDEVSKVTNPIEAADVYEKDSKSLLIDESAFSLEALIRYQKDSDIQRFTKMLVSSLKEGSKDELTKEMDELFSQGVLDPFSLDDVSLLSENEQLLQDLGLKF